MTPVERLQAAIDKLELFAGETWTTSDCTGLTEDDLVDIEASNPGGGRLITPWPMRRFDSELIVTLHRTIVAQLAILRFAVAGGYDLPEFLMLADAILGSDS